MDEKNNNFFYLPEKLPASERKDVYANGTISFFLYTIKKKVDNITLIQQRQFNGTCARRWSSFFLDSFCVVDQSKSIGGHWK